MKRITMTVVLLSLIALGVGPATAQDGYDLFQQALLKERAEGELEEAIQLYGQIVRDFPADRTLAARALVQMGLCHEKLGSQEARNAYRKVVEEYADQSEFVEQARSRLLALTRQPSMTAASTIQLRLLMAGEDNTLGGPYPDGRHFVRINYDTGGLAVRNLVTGESMFPP